MRIGTKSVLFGVHQFAIHPWFVALAWWKLYGFPWHPALWLSFFVHDIGYIGKPNMDGVEGESHPETGAAIVALLFGDRWGEFCLYHSRYYAKRDGHPFSLLCVADKLSFVLTPRWLYRLQSHATGEIREYLKNAEKASDGSHWEGRKRQFNEWHRDLCKYMRAWVDEHKSGKADTWTSANRHTHTASGVWQ
jgi:hypothetical protein